jgi:hypothetical protein
VLLCEFSSSHVGKSEVEKYLCGKDPTANITYV